jgi:hypothetical protein
LALLVPRALYFFKALGFFWGRGASTGDTHWRVKLHRDEGVLLDGGLEAVRVQDKHLAGSVCRSLAAEEASHEHSEGEHGWARHLLCYTRERRYYQVLLDKIKGNFDLVLSFLPLFFAFSFLTRGAPKFDGAYPFCKIKGKSREEDSARCSHLERI